jgi:hypothetical protein
MDTMRRLALLSVSFVLLSSSAATARASAMRGQSDQAPAGSTGTQGAAAENPASNQDTPGATAPSGGAACWQQAGISPKAMRTQRAIMKNAKAQIQKVDEDSSLTPQQQRRQIRQIRQNAKQQIGRVVTPEQEKALRECQRQRKGKAAQPDSSPANPPANEPN